MRIAALFDTAKSFVFLADGQWCSGRIHPSLHGSSQRCKGPRSHQQTGVTEVAETYAPWFEEVVGFVASSLTAATDVICMASHDITLLFWLREAKCSWVVVPCHIFSF